MTDPIPVVVASRQPLLCKGIHRTLVETGDFGVVATITRSRALIPICSRVKPQIAIISRDVIQDQFEKTVQALGRRCVETKILILASRPNERIMPTPALAGIAGYLCWDIQPEALVSAVRSVLQEGVWFSAAIMAEVLGGGTAKEGPVLSERRLSILRYLARGYTDAEIGASLHISTRTVRYHLQKIYDQLDVRSRAAASAEGVRLGLIRLDD
jgi:DNA-binding NarL/FixJ family response regulator